MTIHEFLTIRGVPPEIKDEFKLVCQKQHDSAGRVFRRLMLEHIALSGCPSKLWAGFERVPWKDLRDGDEVFIAGELGGKPHAHGPHIITDARRKELQNAEGRKFLMYQDVMLRKETGR